MLERGWFGEVIYQLMQRTALQNAECAAIVGQLITAQLITAQYQNKHSRISTGAHHSTAQYSTV